MDLLRMVLDARRISPTTATNALTIKDTPERIAAAARVLTAIDKARPEVIIDVELLEVDRTKLPEYGLQIASPGSPGHQRQRSPSTPPAAGHHAVGAAQPDAVGHPAGQSAVALLPAAEERHQHADARQPAAAHDRKASPRRRASAIGAGAGHHVRADRDRRHAQQPITSFNYENIGVNIDITPRTHHDDDVSLTLKVAVTNISGTGFGGLPTFGNREINTVIRLRDGETNMLAGLIRDDERAVAGRHSRAERSAAGRPTVRAQHEVDRPRPTSSSR